MFIIYGMIEIIFFKGLSDETEMGRRWYGDKTILGDESLSEFEFDILQGYCLNPNRYGLFYAPCRMAP